MMRLIASTVLELIANAIGLLVAYLILRPDFMIDAVSFIIVVAIFTAVRFILAPLIFKLSMRYARVLTGGIRWSPSSSRCLSPASFRAA